MSLAELAAVPVSTLLAGAILASSSKLSERQFHRQGEWLGGWRSGFWQIHRLRTLFRVFFLILSRSVRTRHTSTSIISLGAVAGAGNASEGTSPTNFFRAGRILEAMSIFPPAAGSDRTSSRHAGQLGQPAAETFVGGKTAPRAALAPPAAVRRPGKH